MTPPLDWKACLRESDDLTESSTTMYVSTLDAFMRETGSRTIEDLVRAGPKTLLALEDTGLSESALRNRASSVLALLKRCPPLAEACAAERQLWSKAVHERNQKIMERVATAEPSSRETASWVPWKDVLAKEQLMRQTE